MTSARKTLKTLVWSVQNRSIFCEISPENNHKIFHFFTYCFPAKFARKIPAKFPQNRPIFPWFCPQKSRKIWLFFSELSEALFMYTQQIEILVIAMMIDIPSHIGSSQMDTLVPSQNPVFLNWHTHFVVLHFCEWRAPVLDTLFASQGCPLTGASTVPWTAKDQANALMTGFLHTYSMQKKSCPIARGCGFCNWASGSCS